MADITTQTIRVDLNTGKVMPVAYTHQNDSARTFVFDMYNEGLPYSITGHTVKFAYKSPIVNGRYTVIAGSSMAIGTVSGNTVSVTLPADYTAISGVGLLTMIITPTSGTIRPVNIKFIVQKSADGDDQIAGASDFPAALDEIAENWLNENISIQIDDTLSVSGKAADAKVTGDEISELDGQIGDLKSDIIDVNNTLGGTVINGNFSSGSSYYNVDINEALTANDVIVMSAFHSTGTNAKVTLYGVKNNGYTNLGVVNDASYKEITITQNYDSFRFTFYRENSNGEDSLTLLYNTKEQAGIIRQIINNNAQLESDINRLASNMFNAFVTPQMYGALGDGVHDDTTALQTAIDSGKRICIPVGVYMISSSLIINNDSVYIEGVNAFYWTSNGNKNAIIKASANMESVFTIPNGVTCFNLSNVNIDGSSKANYGILHEDDGDLYTHDNVLKNIRIEYCNAVGIKMTSVYKSIFENIRVVHCSTGFNLEGKFNGTAYVSATTLTLIQCYCDYCNSSFIFNRVSYSTLINCASDHTNYFCYQYSVCTNISMINCGCEGAKRVPILFSGISSAIKIDGFSVFALDENLDDNRSGIIITPSGINNLIVSGVVINSVVQREYIIENDNTSVVVVLDASVRQADCKKPTDITFVVPN